MPQGLLTEDPAGKERCGLLGHTPNPSQEGGVMQGTIVKMRVPKKDINI